MLRTRLVTSLLVIPVVVAAIWFGEPWFTILIVVLALRAVVEFYRLAAATGVSALPYFGMALTVLFVVSRNPDVVAWLEQQFDVTPVMPLLLTVTVALPLAWLVLRRRAGQTFTGWAWTVAGILYTGWLLSHLVALRALEPDPVGRNWVLFVVLGTFASDTAAFLVGSRFGRRRLAPEISPNKTWEGAIAGLAGAAALGLFFAAETVFGTDNPLHISGLALWQGGLLGVLVSVFGQVGDLAESLLKRNAAAKDSGGVFPGHGGVLDRIDSIVFAGIVVYYVVVWAIR